ncbi:methyltransferase FkbM domain containing protein [Nitzschia inconspicua]|uniref:Methyltransferase FkbM domain containing protein n=1 Tax=Nitzschia inconspicua TaxID=303405 RepID=A0A9K3LTP5_9STRA|nr:methyltransferase FkbM domain containing protein [Nitzschia inconspicua]
MSLSWWWSSKNPSLKSNGPSPRHQNNINNINNININRSSPRMSPVGINSTMKRLWVRPSSLNTTTTSLGGMILFLAGILVGTVLRPHQTETYILPLQQQQQNQQHERDPTFHPPPFFQQQRQPQKHPHDTHGQKHDNDNGGWHTIHVFTGGTHSRCITSMNSSNKNPSTQRKSAPKAASSSSAQPAAEEAAIPFSFAQARQDEVVLSLLRNQTHGYFIDLASNDATILSNTYILERYYQWKGLCIEPNPIYWYNLTRYRPNCRIVAAVVGNQTMDTVHFDYTQQDHGGIAGTGFDNGPKHQRTSTIEPTVTLQDILNRFHHHNNNNNNDDDDGIPSVIDYLSLDVEGAEQFILQSFLPLQSYMFRIMTIERPKEPLKRSLIQHGYKQLLRLSRWGETLWIHSSFEHEMDLSQLSQFHAKQQWQQQQQKQQQRKQQQRKQ